MRGGGALRRALGAGAAGEARNAGERRIAGAMALQLAARVTGMVVGLITLPLLARTLGASGFGTYTAALAYVSIFGVMTDFGLTAAAMLKMTSEPEREGDWLSALSSLRTLLALGLAAVAAMLVPVALGTEGDVRLVALILCLTIVFGSAQSLMSVFASRLRPGIPLVLTVVQAALWLGTVIALAIADAEPVTVALAYTAMLGAMAVLQVLAARRVVRVSWAGAGGYWRELLRYAVPIGLGALFISTYLKIDAVLLHELADPAEAGVYGGAYRFFEPLTLLPGAIMAALFPVLSAAPERRAALVQRGAELMLALGLPGLAISLPLADPLVELVLGDGFERSAGLLPILMVAFVSICFGNLAGFLAPVLGLQWRIAIYSGIGAVLNVALNLILIPPHGAYGSAWATVATEVVTMVLLLATCLRALQLRLAPGRLVRIVVAAALTFGVAALLANVGLLVALPAAGAVYLGALLGLGAVRIDELRALRAPPQGH